MATERTDLGERTSIWSEWWMYLLLGVSLIVLGILAIVLPFATALFFDTLLGVILVLAAIVHAVYTIGASRWRGFLQSAALTLIYLGVGILLLAWPLIGVFALTMVLAVFLLVQGILRITLASRFRLMPNRYWIAFDGVVSIILSLVILAQLPGAAVWALGLVIGINLISTGIAVAALAYYLRTGHAMITRRIIPGY